MKKFTILLVFVFFTGIIAKAQIHDLGVAKILPQEIYYGDSAKIFPAIKIHNFGTETETSFEVEVTIDDGSGDVYTCSETVTENLSVDSNMYVTMSQVWTITDPELDYDIMAQVTVADDSNSNNNIDIEIPIIIQKTYQSQAYTLLGLSDAEFASINKNTGDTSQILIENPTAGIKGSEFINGILYEIYSNYSPPYNLYVVNNDGTKELVGEITELGNQTLPMIRGLTYDYDNNIVYVAAKFTNQSVDSYLYTMNMQSLELTLIGTIFTGSLTIKDIEYADGKMYGVEWENSSLWEINMQTGNGSYIGVLTGYYFNYNQAISYDRNEGIMYGFFNDMVPKFCTVNLTSGSATTIKEFPSGIAFNFSIQPSALRIITSFQIPEQVGETIINNEAHTVTVTMPYGTNVTNLTPEIEITENAQGIFPISGIPRNFSDPVEYTVTGKYGQEQIWTVTVDVLTDVNENLENNITIYPNPSNGIFTIQNPVGSLRPAGVSITTITGKTIKQFVIRNSQFVVDISNQPTGIYFINIQTETGIYTEKLIIQ